jgi:gamma-glutamylcyclotransferase (GGCT)/AIG2-like uncharacterized protein YtfP
MEPVLFVYGTLRTGETAGALAAPHVTRSVPASVAGRIYAFPMGYPGLIDGDGRVRGELLWLADPAAALALLDAYEGEDFARVQREAWLADGSRVTAWCYVLADPTSVVDAEVILDGDWVRYRTGLAVELVQEVREEGHRQRGE